MTDCCWTRISAIQIDEIRQQLPREDKFAGKGKKRDEIKPLKKQKKGLFGRKKKEEEEDDFFEDADYDEGDDDLFD